MEMYADEEARGGILEPEGIVNIKFRRDKQLDTMARLDFTYGELRRSLDNKSLSQEQISDIKVKLAEREEKLLPVYLQIALQFADLHDRAGRMEAKGAIRQPLKWKDSRRFFYWRLRRRLNEEYMLKAMALSPLAKEGQSTSDSRQHNLRLLQSWSGIEEFQTDDRRVSQWYEEERESITEKVKAMRSDKLAGELAALMRGNQKASWKGVREVLRVMPVEERDEILEWLKD